MDTLKTLNLVKIATVLQIIQTYLKSSISLCTLIHAEYAWKVANTIPLPHFSKQVHM